jgi:hypothetical protein
MRRSTILNISFLLMLVALPLISLGTVNNQTAVWILGAILLVVGLLIPPLLRLRPAANDPKDEPDVEEEPS